jgi:hypothetical protein
MAVGGAEIPRVDAATLTHSQNARRLTVVRGT